MHQRHQVFTIPYGEAKRNEHDETVINFDPDIVSKTPYIFVMPWWDSQNAAVGGIPTVTRLFQKDGEHFVTIRDSNYWGSYFLNILLVHPEENNPFGIRTSMRELRRRDVGSGLLMSDGGVGNDSVNILTSYKAGQHGQVSSIETISSLVNNTANNTFGVSIFSGNSGKTTGLYHLSLERNFIPHAIQVGSSNKQAGDVHRIYFPVPWNQPPVVFVTPWWKDANNSPGSIETINKVTNTYFEVSSGARAPNYYLNWMALSSNPHYEKEHLNTAFDHFFEHFPEYADTIAEHRVDLEKVIYDGEEPSETLAGMQLPKSGKGKGKRSDPSSDPTITGEPRNVDMDIAALAIDGLGLLIATIGFGRAVLSPPVRSAAVTGIAASLSRLETLADEVRPLTATAVALEDKAEKAKAVSRIILFLTTVMFKAGAIKTALGAILNDMSPFQWVVAVLKILAQIAAIVAASLASDGVAGPIIIAGWIGRVTTIILGSVQVGGDINQLVKDFHQKHNVQMP